MPKRHAPKPLGHLASVHLCIVARPRSADRMNPSFDDCLAVEYTNPLFVHNYIRIFVDSSTTIWESTFVFVFYTVYSLLFVIRIGKAYCLESSHIFSDLSELLGDLRAVYVPMTCIPARWKFLGQKLRGCHQLKHNGVSSVFSPNGNAPLSMTPCSSFYTAKLSWQNAENI